MATILQWHFEMHFIFVNSLAPGRFELNLEKVILN